MRKTLGLVTIGQSPRVDLTADVADQLARVDYVEHGALDNIDQTGLENLRPKPGETPLTSRMKDGTNVVMSHADLQPLLTGAVQRCADDGSDAALLLCTGHIPDISATIPVYYCEALSHTCAAELIGNAKLGNMSPMPDQVHDAVSRWRQVLPGAVVGDHANPYTGSIQDVEQAADRLTQHGAEILFLDCIGYTEQMRKAASRRTGLQVLLPRTLAVRHAIDAMVSGVEQSSDTR